MLFLAVCVVSVCVGYHAKILCFLSFSPAAAAADGAEIL